MRVLVILHENPLGSHPHVYEALDSLVVRGSISSYDVYPFRMKRMQGVTDAEISSDILHLARTKDHDVVLLVHTGRMVIEHRTMKALERLPQRPALVYWEIDEYVPFFKPIAPAALPVMRDCHLVFVPGGGRILKTLQQAGVSEVRFAPNTTSPTSFQPRWSPASSAERDLVLIGNRVSSRIPLRIVSGARQRRRLVRAFEKRFGSRFAVYGSGWTGPSAKGPCAFDDQQLLNSTSRVAIGADNASGPYAFSNRLPVALACGVPLMNRLNPGFESIFGADLTDRMFRTVPEAIALAERLLSTSDDDLKEISKANRAFFEKNLTTEILIEHMLRQATAGGSSLPGSTTEVADPNTIHECPAWQRIPPLITQGRING